MGDVQGSGRADDDGVNPFVGKDRVDIGREARSVQGGKLLGGVAEGICDEGERCPRVGGDGLGVNVADPAGADDGDSEHHCFFLTTTRGDVNGVVAPEEHGAADEVTERA